MSRSPGIAAVAVLNAALLCCAYAKASPVPTARLEIARVFSPQSETFLGTLLSVPHDLSWYSVALFNVAEPSEIAGRDVANLLPPVEPIRVNAARAVNTAAIAPMQTFTAPPAVAYAVPAPQPASLKADTPAHKVYAPAQPTANATVTAVAPPRFGSYEPYTPSLPGVSANVNIPVRVGGVRFSGIVSGSQAQTEHTDAFREVAMCGTTDEASACPYLHESSSSSLVAGTNFNVHTWDRDVNLQLSGSVEHLSNGDAAIFPYVPLDPEESFNASRAIAGAPDSSTMLYYPGVTGVVKHGVDARLAVPINQRVTVGLQYNTAHYQGDYGVNMVDGITPGLDARKDTYLGNVTYQLPNMNSAITLSTRLYRYQDGLTQNLNLTQMRTDLNFTVKF